MGRRTAAAATACICTVLAAGLAGPPAVAAETHAPAVDVPAVVVPTIDWAPCGGDFAGVDCARVAVPLDYDEPRGATTTLQLTRIAATDGADRIGTLFLNPGGPGGSGAGFVAVAGQIFSAQTQGRFDVVGFDPRGIGSSDPLTCFDDAQERDAFLASQPIFPWQPRQDRGYFAAAQAFTERCLSRDAPVRPHMSTADVARDLDLLRRAVGDAGLTYLGFSYGSHIGNTYANLFPDRIRALAIDGVLDPQAWTDGTHAQAYDASSTEATLQEFFRLCAEAGAGCAFAGDGRVAARWEALARRLAGSPLILEDEGETFEIGYDLFITLSVSAMYAPPAWPALAELLAALEDAMAGRGTAARVAAARGDLTDVLLPASDMPFPPDYTNGYEGYFGNYCADAELPERLGSWLGGDARTERISRTGPFWWWFNAPCASWPVSEDRYVGPWTASTSAPVLVVGNFFDPATSYESAVRADELLGNSRLLSYAGWGHSAYGVTACATDAIDAYLLEVVLPVPGTVCPAAPSPFEASLRSVAAPVLHVGRPPAFLERPGLGG